MKGELKAGGLALVLPGADILSEWNNAVVRLLKSFTGFELTEWERLYDPVWWNVEATDGRSRKVIMMKTQEYGRDVTAGFAARRLMPLDPGDDVRCEPAEELIDELVDRFFERYSLIPRKQREKS